MPTYTACLARTFLVSLVFSLAPGVALAQGLPPGCDLVDYDPSQRPDPAGTPTEVDVGIYVVHLDRVMEAVTKAAGDK